VKTLNPDWVGAGTAQGDCLILYRPFSALGPVGPPPAPSGVPARNAHYGRSAPFPERPARKRGRSSRSCEATEGRARV